MRGRRSRGKIRRERQAQSRRERGSGHSSRFSLRSPSPMLCWYRYRSKRSSLATCGQRCGHFGFARNRERPSAIRRAWARALTAFTVRPRSAAMSKTEALETMSCRSRSSSPEVHVFALFNFLVSVSPGPGHLNPSNEPGRVALVCRIVSLGRLPHLSQQSPWPNLSRCRSPGRPITRLFDLFGNKLSA